MNCGEMCLFRNGYATSRVQTEEVRRSETALRLRSLFDDLPENTHQRGVAEREYQGPDVGNREEARDRMGKALDAASELDYSLA